MVHFVAHFLIRTLTPFPLHRRSCRMDDNHKWYRSDNTILFKIHKSPEPGDHTRNHNQVQLNAIAVKAPPMVGPTWTRVRLTLGSDCFPALFQGTALSLPVLRGLFIVHTRMIR